MQSMKFYTKPGYKNFLFFQPKLWEKDKMALHELIDEASSRGPNPLDKYRAPTLRLTRVRDY